LTKDTDEDGAWDPRRSGEEKPALSQQRPRNDEWLPHEICAGHLALADGFLDAAAAELEEPADGAEPDADPLLVRHGAHDPDSAARHASDLLDTALGIAEDCGLAESRDAVLCRVARLKYILSDAETAFRILDSVEFSAEGSETRGYAFFLRAEMLTNLVYPSDEVHSAAVAEAMEALESAVECFLPIRNFAKLRECFLLLAHCADELGDEMLREDYADRYCEVDEWCRKGSAALLLEQQSQPAEKTSSPNPADENEAAADAAGEMLQAVYDGPGMMSSSAALAKEPHKRLFTSRLARAGAFAAPADAANLVALLLERTGAPAEELMPGAEDVGHASARRMQAFVRAQRCI